MSHSFASMAQTYLALAAFVGVAASGVLASSAQAQTSDILTIDRLVEHTSTVPAIKGERSACSCASASPPACWNSPAGKAFERKVVLMVHGGFSPATLAFDVQYRDYSWMEQLAREASTCSRWT